MDYLDTFFSVDKLTNVKVVLALAALQGWSLHQLDVNNDFLHRELVEEVYLKPLPGYHFYPSVTSSAPLVCKLSKSLHGLKQASQ